MRDFREITGYARPARSVFDEEVAWQEWMPLPDSLEAVLPKSMIDSIKATASARVRAGRCGEGRGD